MRLGCALVAIALLACGGADAPADDAADEGREALRFALCASNVASVDLAQSPDGAQRAVHVMLVPAAAAQLAALSEANVGRDLAVVYGSEILAVAPISGRIASGVITAAPLKIEDAERHQRGLAMLPEAPCGAAAPAGS